MELVCIIVGYSLFLLFLLAIRKNEDGVPEAEENFEEAIRAVNYALVPTAIPKDIQDILNDNACINLTSKVIYIHFVFNL